MNEAIDRAIEVLTNQAIRYEYSGEEKVNSNDALKFSQAALNLAHVKSVMSELES